MSLVECNNLSKQYGGKPALNRIDLNLESGKIIGLLGPNGSGKTTGTGTGGAASETKPS